MMQPPSPPLRCDCCGLQIFTQQTEYCPRCKYPTNASKEEHFLALSVSDLQRIEANGGSAFTIPALLKLYQSVVPALPDLRRTALYVGGNLTVTELIHRQQTRLEQLRQHKTVEVLPEEDAHPQIPAVQGSQAIHSLPTKSLPQPFMRAPVGGEETVDVTDMEEGRLVSQLVVPTPTSKQGRKPPVNQLVRPGIAQAQPTNIAGIRLQRTQRTNVPIPKPRNTARAAALKTFFIGSPISLMVLLGAFLILMAMLTFVLSPADPVHRSNPLLAFLVVLGTQVFFGAASIGTQHRSKFINVARIYTFVFVLLIPLLGIEGYLLLEKQALHIGLPVIIVIAALYAAIAYGAFAVYQRFSPFGYLGMMALVAADVAAVNALHLGIEWYAAALMILALPALATVPRSFDNSTSSLAVLRNPVRICMFCVVACVLVMMPLIFNVFVINHTFGLVASSFSVRFAKLSGWLLVLLWSALFLRLTKLTGKAVPFVPYLFLVGVLDSAHTLEFQAMGYALVLTGVAVLYHGISRFGQRLLEPFGKLGLRLDQLALLLVSAVPLMSALYVPFQLLNKTPPGIWPFFSVQSGWGLVFILSLGVLLTISVILSRANATRAGTYYGWPWLLLLSGVLLNWTYGALILLLHVDLSLCFFGLTLSLIVLTVIVRRRFGGVWANPLDVLVLGETALILSVSGTKPDSGNSLGVLLLFIAALFYGVLLFQHRHRLLALPFVFALAALPLVRPELRLVMGIGLPLAAIAIQHLIAGEPLFTLPSLSAKKQWQHQLTLGKEWPLLLIGLVCGAAVSLQDVATATGTLQSWLGVALPLAIEITIFALVWYVVAVLTREKWFLLLTTGFAIAALLSSPTPFWILVGITTLVAWVGLAISRVFDRVWAAPWSIAALLGAVLAGITGYVQGQLPATVWVLLGFALLAYVMGVAEDLGLVLWLTPVFSIWSVFGSLILNDYYRAPIAVLLCTLIGVGIGLPRLSSVPPFKPDLVRKLRKYALPFYTTAIAAAVLTGLTGMLIGSDELLHQYNPFVLLAFASISYGVLLYERRPRELWLATGFALWGMILLPTVDVLGFGLGVGVVGLIVGRVFKRGVGIEYGLPFYVTALVAAVLMGIHSIYEPSASTAEYGLLAFTVLSVVVMLVERRPEALLVPTGLAVWAIGLTHWNRPQQMVAYSLLCVLIFASQFIWKVVPSVKDALTSVGLPRALGLGGQVLVVLGIVVQAAVLANAPVIDHVGAGALGVLALLLVWQGYTQHGTSVRHWCNYGAGLLVALVVSWELIAFGQTKLDLLLLAPGSYLSVIAPFLMRDKAMKEAKRVGQLIAVMGAALLLVPTGIVSIVGNQQDDLLSTLLLLGESLSLFFLGIATRVRFFILGGAGLVIVGTIRALFLPPSFIPIWVVLVVSGGALLVGATLLTLRGREERMAETE